ncbi:alpha/beta hydrolase [Aurantiacibacter luteus]|uniref:Xylanase n=1 Tax=Aurantiacibacter luteus TaxID=1581420 RepID=A0A0G9MX62_9SPHN|nr:alpha/beta hydrolase [Aurantiacibacter luteus]KLE33863.1 xylanase [Aurantiacibacter luteus]
MTTRRDLFAMTLAAGAIHAAGPMVGASAHELEEILLWPGTPPGGGGVSGEEEVGTSGAGYGAVSNIAVPRMRVYRPNHPNGRAVIVCGGGGYFRIQLWKESTPAALWLQTHGYTVFELLYRLPDDGWERGAPFADAQRAMRIVRSRAADFGIDPAKIGIMGFSAGGHLAGYTALRPAQPIYTTVDAIDTVSARPDFAALLFPVVSMSAPYDTTRTRRILVGEGANPEQEAFWSLDRLANAEAAPTIIFSAADDPTTPPGHGIALFQALVGAGVPAELHIFENGGHGWGLGTPDQTLSQWPDIFDAWITRRAPTPTPTGTR